MVPHVAESPRRVDKTAVLRFAAHGLRLKYGKCNVYLTLQMTVMFIYLQNTDYTYIYLGT